MRIQILVLLAVSVLSFSMSGVLRKELGESEAAFIEWVMKNQANYLTIEELNFRKAVFAENKAIVDSLNADSN